MKNSKQIENFYGEIRDPLFGDIRLYRYEMEIINTSPFQRLRGLRQLPGCEYVYPSMTHTRFSHCLGVLGVSIKILQFSDLNLSEKDVRLLRLIALLHDIEEPPFFNALLHEPFITEKLRTKIRERKIKKIFEECKMKKVEFPVSLQEIFDAFNGKKKQYIRSLINCEIGANRLDYLQRDAYFCGVKYGYIDDRILSSFAIEENELVLKSESIPIAEDILHNLYQMKLNVYDHKVVRSYLTLIRDAFKITYDKNSKLESIFDMTDDEFFQTLDSQTIKKIRDRKLPKLVYELNTFQLKNPHMVKNLDKMIRDKIEPLVNYIAANSDLNEKDIRIEPVELRKVGGAEPLMVRYKRKGWDERRDSKRTYDLRPLQDSSRTIKEWSEFFYQQWRVFIFCFVGETWDIKKIDQMREKVADACDNVLGFLKHGEFEKSALPEFRETYVDFNKQDPQQIRQVIFKQSNLSKKILKFLHTKKLSTTDKIKKSLDISRTSASLILNKLEKEQLVTKNRIGKSVSFTLTPTTEEIMKDLYEPSLLNN